MITDQANAKGHVRAPFCFLPEGNIADKQIADDCLLPYPLACISEHPHPWAIFAPFRWSPQALNSAKYAFKMRHDNGESSIQSGQTGNPLRRTVGVEQIDGHRFTAVVDEAHRNQRADRLELHLT